MQIQFGQFVVDRSGHLTLHHYYRKKQDKTKEGKREIERVFVSLVCALVLNLIN